MENRIITPIGVVKNNFPTKFGLPRQSGLAKVHSKIVFDKKFSDIDAVRGIDGFSHLWIIWGFIQENKEFSPTVRPPMLGGNERVGVFATRSPNRPNGLGMSVVKLLSVERENGQTVLNVSGGDFLDGTAVFDVKPYLRYADSIENAVDGFAKDKEEYLLTVKYECNVDDFSDEEREELTDALSRDPRPQYHADGRQYGLLYKDKDVKFVVESGTLKVKEIKDAK